MDRDRLIVMLMIDTPSPNFDDRPQQKKPNFIIIHYTAMAGTAEVIKRFQDPASKVSSHYLLDQDGAIHAMVAPEKRAWHAGKSHWLGLDKMNDHSIGIELDNRGHNRGYHDFTHQQMESVIDLCTELQERFNIPAQNVLGHSDVSPGRKQDPGERFDWYSLAKEGIGVWPSEEPVVTPPQSLQEAQQMLQLIGYDIGITGIADEQTVHVVNAFKQHYAPRDMTSRDLLPNTTCMQLAGMPQLADTLTFAPVEPTPRPKQRHLRR